MVAGTLIPLQLDVRTHPRRAVVILAGGLAESILIISGCSGIHFYLAFANSEEKMRSQKNAYTQGWMLGILV